MVKTSSTAGSAEAAAPADTKEPAPAAAAGAKETKTVTVKEVEKEKEGRETEISKAYQIFPDEVLGSGQFGIVYGGVHRSENIIFIIHNKNVKHPNLLCNVYCLQ